MLNRRANKLSARWDWSGGGLFWGGSERSTPVLVINGYLLFSYAIVKATMALLRRWRNALEAQPIGVQAARTLPVVGKSNGVGARAIAECYN